MTTHFHVDGALWEGDYSAQARTILLTDRLFQKKIRGNIGWHQVNPVYRTVLLTPFDCSMFNKERSEVFMSCF